MFHLHVHKLYNSNFGLFMWNTKVTYSDTFLQTVLEPHKQRRLNFRNVKQTLVLVQFMVVDFVQFLLSDIKWDNHE